MKLIFVLFCFFLISATFAADTAFVVADKAVIYSDMELNVPIGYARKGKRIKVGEVARKNGTVLSTVVSGRIAYIKKIDIRLSQEISDDGGTYVTPKVTEHEVLFEQQNFEDNFRENNHVIFHAGNMATGTQWQELQSGSENQSLSQFGIAIEHRPELRNYSWAIGLSYLSTELDSYAFKSILVEGKLQYSVARFDLIALDAVFGIVGTGDARLQNSISGNESRGTILGYILGAQAKLFPFSKFGVIGGVELRKYSVGSIGDIELQDGSIGSLDTFSGANIWAGITYKL